MDLKNKKIVVTGGAGFLGSYVVSYLKKIHVPQKNIIVPRTSQTDLRIKSQCEKIVKGADIIIHLAGNVGGIGKNLEQPATLLYENAIMGLHLIEAAAGAGVQKVVIIGTICAYPKYTPVPFREEDLWMGYPEETNAPYGLAKKLLLVASQAYRREHNLNSIYLLPVNLYGPGDNVDLSTSHVIPALIHKIYDAKIHKKPSVVVWGDGTATREFLYVEDAARAIVLALQKYDKADPINIGSGFEISIKDLVTTIARILKYKGDIVWDTSRPNGQPRRLLDVSKAKKEFGFRAKIPFAIGLKRTVQWYIKKGQYERH